MQAEVKDLSLLSLTDLETMLQADPRNVDVLRAMLPLSRRYSREDLLHRAFHTAGPTLADREPELVGQYLTSYDGHHEFYNARQLIRVARHLESRATAVDAISLYQTIIRQHDNTPEHETALYRLALCSWDRMKNAPQARTCLHELIARYPYGAMEPHARALLRQIGQD